jgi:hypothetical protein
VSNSPKNGNGLLIKAKNLQLRCDGFKVSKPNVLNWKKIVNKVNYCINWKKEQKKIAKQITAK